MLQDIGTDTITLTPAAADSVRGILNERQLEGYALRVFVSGGGCCSTKFGMALDNKFHENDLSFESEGVKIVVDGVSIDYLRGAKVDFVNDPQYGAGFVVESPSARSKSGDSCGCGGHGHAEDSEGGSCGCGGGSCGCGN